MPTKKAKSKNRTNSSTKNNSRAMNCFVKKNKEAFPVIINNIPQLVFWKDLEGLYMGCNQKFADAFDHSDAMKLVGKTDFDLLDNEKAEHFKKIDEEIIATDKPKFHMIEKSIGRDGQEIWTDISKAPLHDIDGQTIGIIGTIENITERKKIETKLKQNEEKYRNLIEFTNIGFVILNLKLEILEANKTYKKIIGNESDKDILGRNPRSWVSSEDIENFDKAFRKLLAGHAINDLELTFISENKELVYVRLNANLILENGDRKIICLIKDISDQRALKELQYIEQQKFKDKLKQNISQFRKSLREVRLGKT